MVDLGKVAMSLLQSVNETLTKKKNKVNGEVLLTDYWQVPDANNNYTNAFKRAFDVLSSAGGGKVVVPTGTFEAVVKIPSNCGIKGMGTKSIIKLPNNSTEHCIQLYNNTTKFVTVENLSILGNKANQTNQLDGIHFYVTTTYDYDNVFTSVSSPVNQIRNVLVFGCSGYGVYLEGKGHGRFNNIDVYDSGRSGFAIYSYDNYFIDCASGQNYENGFVIQSNNNHLINFKAWNNGLGNTSKTAGYGVYSNNSYWLELQGETQANLLDGVYLIGAQNSLVNVIIDTSGQRDSIVTNGVYGLKMENCLRNVVSATVNNRPDRNENKILYALGMFGTVKDNIFKITCSSMAQGPVYFDNPSYDQFVNVIDVCGTDLTKSFEKKEFKNFSTFTTWAAIQGTLMTGETYVADYNNFNTSLLPASITYGTLTIKKGSSGGRLTVELVGLNANKTNLLHYLGVYDNSTTNMVWKQISVVDGKYTGNGNGTTSLTISHDLGVTPSYVDVQAGSSDAGTAGIKYITSDATNITVNFSNATTVGTNNIVLYWRAKP
ncbi:hypothetical protein P4639_14635 [Priestia megaterium]|uniref:hypothetical protein n=1 Tax=Priestia megaterium TaxID=1404 RepID=UPI002E208858|nr:hypothetical protein [Priestia megaterium]